MGNYNMIPIALIYKSCISKIDNLLAQVAYAIIIIFSTLYFSSLFGQEPNLHCLDQYWYLDGENDEQNFGFKVAGNIDVNLDSLKDILVVSGSFNPQIVEIYFGTTSGWSHENKTRLEYSAGSDSSLYSFLGADFSTDGDINGDGYNDLVLGDSFNNKVYVYYSSIEFSGEYDFQFSTGEYPYSNISPLNLSANIDFNEDGYHDIVVSASLMRYETKVFFGGPDIDGDADLILPYPPEFNASEMSGTGAYISGDFNDDGYQDLANSYFYAPDSVHNAGLVVVSFGGELGYNFETDWYYIGNFPDNSLGFSLQKDDFNHDGVDDILAGGHNNALEFFGGSEFDTIPDFQFYNDGPFHNEMRFELLQTNIDINGDGHKDYISSNPGYSWGMLFFTLGGPGNDGLHDCTLMYPDDFSERFGRSFSSVGDVNGDGIDDIIVGDGRDDPWPNPPRGRISVYLGNADVVGLPAISPVHPMKMELEVTTYPNPFNDTIVIDIISQNSEATTIEIYSMRGSLLHKEVINRSTFTSSNTLELGFLPSGIYMLSVIDSSLHGKHVRRTVKICHLK